MSRAGDAGCIKHAFLCGPGNILIGEMDIGVTHDPNRSPAVLEHVLQGSQPQQRLVGGGRAEVGVLIVICIDEGVLVTVDQPRQQSHPGHGEGFQAGWQGRDGGNSDDTVAIHDDRMIDQCVIPDPVDDGIWHQGDGGRYCQ